MERVRKNPSNLGNVNQSDVVQVDDVLSHAVKVSGGASRRLDEKWPIECQPNLGLDEWS
jgi:hypothetical protein